MTRKRSFRLVLTLVVAVAIIASMFGLVACKGKDNSASNLKKPGDVFALAGVSTGAMLQSMSTNGVAMASDEASIKAALDENMALIDAIVAGDPTANDKDVKSDRAEYAHMQVMKVPGMDGKMTEYRLYYNDKPKAEEEEEENADEEEYESHIEGIMVIEGNEYPITGDIEVETAEGESEQSIEFVAYLNEEKSDYIKFELEAETETEDGTTENETEYKYSIYENSKFVRSFNLEVENEGTEESYSIKTKDAKNGTIKFKLEKETKGDKTDIIAKYVAADETIKFRVEAKVDEAGETTYEYTRI